MKYIETILDNKVYRGVIKSNGYSFEAYITESNNNIAQPTVVLVHGYNKEIGKHNDKHSGGAKTYFENNRNFLLKLGYKVAAVTLPGFGETPGQEDFWGPHSQGCVVESIDYLRKSHSLHQIALMGTSGGATVSAMVAARIGGLSGVVLISGGYDFTCSKQILNSALRQKLITIVGFEEGEVSRAALKERSAIFHTDKIKCPVLVLHGSADDRNSTYVACQFAQKLKETNSDVDIKVFPNEPHRICDDLIKGEVSPFLLRIFGC